MKSAQLLRVVYLAAKSNGLALFHLSAQHATTTPTVRAQLTTASTCLGIAVSIGLNGLFAWSMLKYLVYPPEEEEEETLLVVVKLDSIAGILRNCLISAVVIVHRNVLVQTINEVQRIVDQIKSIAQFTHFLDRKCRRMVRTQMLVASCQLILVCLMIYLHFEFSADQTVFEYVRVVTMMVLNNVYEMVVSAMHFTALLVMTQLFRHINHQLTQCVQRIRTIAQMDRRRSSSSTLRMQMHCDISDRIDVIASLYKTVATCNQRRLCKVFSGTMLATLTYSFVMLLAQVIRARAMDAKYRWT